MADAPKSGEWQVSTGDTGGQGGAATQASSATSIPANFNPTESGQSGQTTVWSVKDPSLQSKGWKTQDDFERSYRELESDRSQRVSELQKLQAEYQRYAAFIERLEPYAEYIQQLLEGKQFSFNGVNSDKSKPDPVEQKFATVQDQLRQQQEAFVANVRSESIEQFFTEHPDARQLENEMAEVIRSGVVRVSDLSKRSAYLEAFRAALAVVKANRAPKEGAAAAAAKVSGAGNAAEAGTLSDSQARWNLFKSQGADAMLAGIKSGSIR